MFRKILPQHPLARLYVGSYAVITAIGLTVTVATLVVNRFVPVPR